MTLHWLYLTMLAVAFAASGCAGSNAIPGVASEEDVVVATAYDYLRASDAIGSTEQYRASVVPVAEDVFPVHDPTGPPGNAYDSAPTPWSAQWNVSFEVYDAFGEPAGQITVGVRRYDGAEGPRYVAEPDES